MRAVWICLSFWSFAASAGDAIDDQATTASTSSCSVTQAEAGAAPISSEFEAPQPPRKRYGAVDLLQTSQHMAAPIPSTKATMESSPASFAPYPASSAQGPLQAAISGNIGAATAFTKSPFAQHIRMVVGTALVTRAGKGVLIISAASSILCLILLSFIHVASTEKIRAAKAKEAIGVTLVQDTRFAFSTASAAQSRAGAREAGRCRPRLSWLPWQRDAHPYYKLILPMALVVPCFYFFTLWLVLPDLDTDLERDALLVDSVVRWTMKAHNGLVFWCFVIFPVAVYVLWNVFFTAIMIEKLRLGAQPPRQSAKSCSNSGDAIELLHVVVIPMYREPWEVLQRTIRSLAEQSVPLERRCLLMAFEASDESSWEMERQIRLRFGSFFHNIWTTRHTLVQGEEAGKGSNENHAVRWLYKELAEEHDPDAVMITIADADSDFSPVYLQHVEAAFNEQPDGTIVMYDGALNTWGNFLDTWNPVIRHHEMRRCQSHYQTLWLGRHHAMSNYSLTLGLAHHIDYWTPDTMQEDHHTYTKIQVLLREGAPAVPVYALIVNDMVGSTADRYVQAKRHAWGITEFPWVLTLYPHLEFKNFLSLLIENWYSQITVHVLPWWALFLYPMTWRLIAAFSPTTRAFMVSLFAIRYATRWSCDTVEAGYIWYGALADRSSVPKPHIASFIFLRLFDAPLGFIGDLIFVFCPRWHVAVRSFFTPYLQYINAPKGSKPQTAGTKPQTATSKTPEVRSNPTTPEKQAAKTSDVRPLPESCNNSAPKKMSHAVASGHAAGSADAPLPTRKAPALTTRKVDGVPS